MSTHSSVLAWEIPWAKELGGVAKSMGLQRVRYNLVTKQNRIRGEQMKLVEKVKAFQAESESCSVVSDSLQPHGLSLEFSRPEYWIG